MIRQLELASHVAGVALLSFELSTDSDLTFVHISMTRFLVD